MSFSKPEILKEFTVQLPELKGAANAIETYLKALIQSSGLKVHSFYGRIKTEESLSQKVSRPDRTYASVWDITDLIGIRIVTAFEDSIPELASLIEHRFAVDLSHSRNRLQYDDHERFGYKSLHYVCRFPEGTRLPPEARFEIQVRTALQDVWAEIEHDLGYKATDLAPSHLRRRFSRVSSLLEIADEELVNVKAELKLYLDGQRDQARLDLVSLGELAVHPLMYKIDSEIARQLGLKLSGRNFFPDYLLKALRAAEITTIEGALKALTELEPKILKFVPTYFEFADKALGLRKTSITTIERGYALLFMVHTHVLATESLSVNRTKRFFDLYAKLDYPDDHRKARDVAETLVAMLPAD